MSGDDCSGRPALRMGARDVAQVDAEVGERLRLRRVMLGLTQLDLAKRCNISPQQIHKYEIGASRLTTTRLLQMSAALDVKVGWFFGEDDSTSIMPNDFFELLADHNNLEILMAAASIKNPKRKARLVRVALLFAEEEDEGSAKQKVVQIAARR
ncbi:MAG: helix-turn-helix domain-containing protein [Hyphomicrobiaceae bacterium]